jgi:HD-GYP domain-containing protein (c-di-GMP phosphodiesterase class II)
MKKHPGYAFQLLSRVPYLRGALDIPYAHHEHWDGSGYPRGLRGSEIPLAARIFAVVDIWDALSFDRPYNKAWNDSAIRQHLLSLSGKQLDAHVVEAFLKLDLQV